METHRGGLAASCLLATSTIALVNTVEYQNYQVNFNQKHQISANSPLTTTSNKIDSSVSIPTNDTIGARTLFQNSNIDDVTINYTSADNAITIVGAESDIDATGYDLTMLDSINGVPITTIGDKAFDGYYNKIITCNSLNLNNCTHLTKFGIRCFRSCRFKNVNLPESLTTLGAIAFMDCRNLTSMDFSVCNQFDTSGFYETFDGCSSLTSIIFPSNSNFTELGGMTFLDCTSLASITIPDTVTIIGMNCFRDCSALGAVTLPDSVTTVSTTAFYGCSSLTSISFPSGLTTLSSDAFTNCSGITSVDLTRCGENLPTTWPDSVFSSFSSSAEWFLPYTTSDDEYSAWLSAITNWYGSSPSSVEFFNDASTYASGVTDGKFKIKLDNPLSLNSPRTLVDGSSVKANDLVIKEDANIDNLGENAFLSNTGLTSSVTLPSTITSIGANVFKGCTNVNKICLSWTDLSRIITLSVNQDWLGGASSTTLNKPETTISVPKGMKDTYQAVATAWGMDQCTITDDFVPPSPTPTPTDNNNLGLILGLSLGIGIPVMIGVITGIVVGVKKHQNKGKKK